MVVVLCEEVLVIHELHGLPQARVDHSSSECIGR
jgi:hypothetical protein